MAYGDNNNKPEFEAGAPKKADVLIRSTQYIAMKQEELSEQTKLAVSRLDEAIELFSKNNQDSTYVVKQSSELFDQLQSDNSALKQELLYLAKQSENIYSGLAEKLTELTEHSKDRDDSLTGLADKLNDVAEQARKSEAIYAEITDSIARLTEQNKRNEQMFAELNSKLDAISAHNAKNEKAYGELSDRIGDGVKAEPVAVDNSDVMEKLNRITDMLRKTEGAHSMLADKFEILSMRVEQFSFESAKSSMPYAQPQQASYQPVQTVVKEQAIDYDRLAEKVAALISTREAVSPDYIASKVAEQIVLPEIEAANVKLSVDSNEIARQVASLVNANQVAAQPVQVAPVVNINEDAIADKITQRLGSVRTSETAVTSVSLDEDSIADKIAQKLGGIHNQETAVAAIDLDEEVIADKIAQKLSGKTSNVQTVAASSSSYDIDEEELADSIALKVGSLKAEDFDILVDDEGCSSLSKEIVNNLDYNKISNIIADKLREVLDLAAVNAPDYEDMAERISEKITVAGINEDAIADKAAAVLSNYLPEFDTDDITDKITGAVIDVVSAMPQPTLDNQAICDAITEKLIESQEDHDYDIVIDDEGLSRITDVVSEEIEKETSARFDRVEENIAKLTEILTARKDEEQQIVAEPVEEQSVQTVETTAAIAVEDYEKLTDIMAAEIEKGTSARFDRVEENIAKLTELLESAVTEEESDGYEQYDEEEEDDEYSVISEIVANEIQTGIASRLDSLEQNIALITEAVTVSEDEAVEESEEVETAEDETVEEYDEYEGEDYTALTEAVAAEVDKVVTTRLESVEQNIAKLTELISTVEQPEQAEVAVATAVEPDYDRISEVVAAEIEKSVTYRLDNVEENITKLADMISTEEQPEQTEVAVATAVEPDYDRISEVVAAEIEKGVTYRLDSVERNILDKLEEVKLSEEKPEEVAIHDYTKISDMVVTEPDYDKLSDIVAAEIQKGFDDNLTKLNELMSVEQVNVVHVDTEHGAQSNSEQAEILITEDDYGALTKIFTDEVQKIISTHIEGVEQNIAKLTEMIAVEESEEQAGEVVEEQDYTALSEAVAAEIEKVVCDRLDGVEQNIAKLTEMITVEESEEQSDEVVEEQDYTALSEAVAAEIEKVVCDRLDGVEQNIAKLTELITEEDVETVEDYAEDYTDISEVVATEIQKGMGERFDKVEEQIANISRIITNAEIQSAASDQTSSTDLSAVVATEVQKGIGERFDKVEEQIAKISEIVESGLATEVVTQKVEEDYGAISDVVAAEIERGITARLDNVEQNINKLSEMVTDNNTSPAYLDKISKDIEKITDMVQSQAQTPDDRFVKFSDEVAEIKRMLADGVLVAGAAAAAETASSAVQAVEPEEEQELVTVSDLVQPEEIEEIIEEPVEEQTVTEPAVEEVEVKPAEEEFEEDEEEEDDGDDGDDDFSIGVFDMDAFSDDELMPGEMSDYAGGVDFANMMKFKRSFIARIIQSSDEYKQYYGEVKHALLSYKKVNSNVAWGAERFNKGRETIARMKIRGKTLCLYLALDPNDYKISVYHHLDVSDNKSVAGTPMMVKIKSNLGVRKAIRLIDEMLAKRNGEKKEIPERDYASMYPYETIEELIDEGLVKDVRNKNR